MRRRLPSERVEQVRRASSDGLPFVQKSDGRAPRTLGNGFDRRPGENFDSFILKGGLDDPGGFPRVIA
jgi:hypothetical protein